MGTLGSLTMGLLLGSAANKKAPTLNLPTQVHTEMATEKPVVPEAPVDTAKADSGVTTDNELMEMERERQRQALREKAAQEVFTSGLGAAGLAETSKKTLLGG
ncbi:MAG: hypothetical protein LUG50_13650 [Planctomycetaceae bacterium]|nr:hypothetical protein [Planctomycetaceae bacterium]